MLKIKKISKQYMNKIPKTCGIYFLYGKSAEKPLYIGKTISLRKRVKHHFKNPSWLFEEKIKNIKTIGYIETDSEIEALILESQFIKKLQPKFNIMLRDDKNYFYVGITNEEFPRVFLTHQPSATAKIKNTFIGPFVNGKALKQTLKWLRKIFPYRSCKNKPEKPCFWWHLGLCPAHYKNENEKAAAQKKYKKNLKNLIDVLEGKKQTVLNNLKREMKIAAKNEEFEVAAKIRDQIINLENIFEHRKLLDAFGANEMAPTSKTKQKNALKQLKNLLTLKKTPKRIEAYDISNIQGKFSTGSMVVFINGQADKNCYRKFKIRNQNTPNDIAMLKEVLFRRFQHKEWPYPDLILIDGGMAQLNTAKLIIKQNDLTIPIIALAKRKNKLHCEDQKPILLKNLPSEISNLILYLRDEAHRFAINYHKKLRQKELLK